MTIRASAAATPPATPAPPLRLRRKRNPEPLRYLDAAGNRLVKVPLSTGRCATLNAADFERLTADLGMTPFWYENDNGSGQTYVRCRVPGLKKSGTVMVARLILESPNGSVIVYRNKDRLDLRRENLGTVTGHSEGRAKAIIEKADEIAASWQIHRLAEVRQRPRSPR